MSKERPELNLQRLYQDRFPEAELDEKRAIWQVLCSDFFSRYVPEGAVVVDVGAGYCEFINNIRAARRIAIDVNPDISRFAAAGVEIIASPAWDMIGVEDSSVDVVFMSNFLEHLHSQEDVLATLRECQRVLRDGGRVMILQPNIRVLGGKYWDFFDHRTALSDRSLTEVLTLIGMRVTVCHARFLPYTTKSRLPKAAIFVRWYLRLPILWRLFGKQAFLVAEK